MSRIAAGLAILVMGGLAGCAPRPFEETLCDQPGESIVRIGELRLAIPSTLRGAFISMSGGPSLESLSARERTYSKVCPNPDGTEHVVNGLGVYTPPPADRTDTHFPFSVDMQVYSTNIALGDLYIAHDWSRSRFEDAGDGFIALKDVTVGFGGEVFLQREATDYTPEGNPVAIACYRIGQSSERARGRECFTWWVDPSGAMVDIHFHDGEYPRSQWLDLVDGVREAVDRMRLDTAVEDGASAGP